MENNLLIANIERHENMKQWLITFPAIPGLCAIADSEEEAKILAREKAQELISQKAQEHNIEGKAYLDEVQTRITTDNISDSRVLVHVYDSATTADIMLIGKQSMKNILVDMALKSAIYLKEKQDEN